MNPSNLPLFYAFLCLLLPILGEEADCGKSDDLEQLVEVDGSLSEGRRKLATDDVEPKEEVTTKQIPFSITFWNHMAKPVNLVWDNVDEKKDDTQFGLIEVGDSKVFTSYEHHRWYAADPETGEELQSFFITPALSAYVLQPKAVRDAKDKVYEAEKKKFMEDYLERTGRRWNSIYPRDPVSFFMWDPKEVGYKQTAHTTAAFWTNTTTFDGPKDCALDNPMDVECPEEFEHENLGHVHKPTPESMEITLETISVSPAAFRIHNVMTRDEADHIIEVGESIGLRRSVVKTTGETTEARTSTNCWIDHDHDEIITNIYDRIADLTNIPRFKLERGQSAESIQFVHYGVSQEYRAHHDYLDPILHANDARVMSGQNRLATFLFYLNDVEEGGHTSFPDSTATKDELISSKPIKGSAVLFYSMQPDGNLDERSLHAGMPVIKGEKYIANLWIWDPKFR